MAATTEEGSLTLEDGTKLYTKKWKVSGKPAAKLFFLHGFSDHCNAYGIFFPRLASRGIEVFSFDQRGWGRSVTTPASRGVTGPSSQIMADVSLVLATYLPRPDVPVFLMGHSMGGGIALNYMAAGPRNLVEQLRGVLLESPFLALAPSSAASKFTIVVGRLASKMMPNHQMLNKLNASLLSRDPEVCQAFVDDPLCHDIGSLECLSAMLDRASHLANGQLRIPENVPVWASHGTEDGITDHPTTRRWADGLRNPDKEFKSYDGWFHKLHAEPGEDKVIFANDVADWILARSDGDGSKSKL